MRAGKPWRDPTFFAFVLFGVALLCGGLLCHAKAVTLDPRSASAPLFGAPAASFVAPIYGELKPSDDPFAHPRPPMKF